MSCSRTLRNAQSGIEPATLRLPDDSSHLLSHVAPHWMGPMLTVSMLPLGRILPRLTFFKITLYILLNKDSYLSELHKDDIFAQIAVHDSAVHHPKFMCKQPESDVDTEMAES